MQEVPETRDSLIVQVQNPLNRKAWDQFAMIYRPVIYRLARQKGLQDADAQDLAQQVLHAVSQSIGRWEKLDPPNKFRHWLRRVVRNAILNALSRQPRYGAAGGSVALELLNQHCCLHS
ncbi:sigma-70 family RNA polymerase sigma factor [Mariniblastus sp.]|nr:sigma-70 family RNA polymerase sigma factor [Mariniblastus sp.]